jgi:hypothetical protein
MAESLWKYLKRPFTNKAQEAYEEEEGLKLGDKNLKSVQSDKEQLNIRRSERPQSKMTSSKNVEEYPSLSAGRGTVSNFKPTRPTTRKTSTSTPTTKSTPTPPRENTKYDSGETNPAEFSPGKMGRENVAPGGGSTANIDTSKIGKGGFEASAVKFEDESAKPFWDRFGKKSSSSEYSKVDADEEYKRGGKVKKSNKAKKSSSGSSGSSASKRSDGCAQRGKTRGRIV